MSVPETILQLRERLSASHPGLPVKCDPSGFVLRIRDDRLRIDVGVDRPRFGTGHFVVRVTGDQDHVLGRLLPPDARLMNADEHTVCLGPYRGVVSGVELCTMRRLLAFAFDFSPDPARLLDPVMVLLAILVGGPVPSDYAVAMYYSLPAPEDVRWRTRLFC
jgi:hypothetical protein